MPRETIVYVICSLCRERSIDPAKFAAYRLEGPGRPLTFDICTTCQQSHEGFTSFVAVGIPEERKQGRPKKSVAVVVADPTSPICPECGKSYANENGLAQHRARVHDVLSRSAAEVAARGQDGEYVCDEKGCDFRSPRPQGLAAHKRTHVKQLKKSA